MNTKVLLKTIFLIAILLLLVIMGMNNRRDVELAMPPLWSKPQKLPGAIMYFGFFGIGVLSGTILTSGTREAEKVNDRTGPQSSCSARSAAQNHSDRPITEH
jgi:hypothetical protein